MAYDPEAKRTLILAAATEEFAARGLAGARVDRIAARAGVNKQLLYRYFVDKETLFACVLERVLSALTESVRLDPHDPLAYVGQLFDFHAAHPEAIRLAQWEALERGGSQAPPEVVDGAEAAPSPRAARYQDKVEAMRTAQRLGLVDPAADPAQLVHQLVSLVDWYFAAPQLAAMILGVSPDAPDARYLQREHVLATARRLLATSTMGKP